MHVVKVVFRIEPAHPGSAHCRAFDRDMADRVAGRTVKVCERFDPS